MLRLVQPTLAAVVALSAASAVMAQGFSLNPFTKQEPADPGSVRRTASDARPAEKTSPFSLPKLSMPSMPKLPGMGAKPKPAKPVNNQPSMLTASAGWIDAARQAGYTDASIHRRSAMNAMRETSSSCIETG